MKFFNIRLVRVLIVIAAYTVLGKVMQYAGSGTMTDFFILAILVISIENQFDLQELKSRENE